MVGLMMTDGDVWMRVTCKHNSSGQALHRNTHNGDQPENRKMIIQDLNCFQTESRLIIGSCRSDISLCFACQIVSTIQLLNFLAPEHSQQTLQLFVINFVAHKQQCCGSRTWFSFLRSVRNHHTPTRILASGNCLRKLIVKAALPCSHGSLKGGI